MARVETGCISESTSKGFMTIKIIEKIAESHVFHVNCACHTGILAGGVAE